MTLRDSIVAFVDGYIADHGFSPTVREIAAGVGLASSSTAHKHLRALALEGRLTYDPARPRTIRPVPEASA